MKQAFPYSAFGKMSFASEFVKINLNRPEFIQLELWYRKAYRHFTHQYGDMSKRYLSEMPSYHYLYSNWHQHTSIMGSVYASADSHGREYPFVLSCKLEDPIEQQFLTSVPLLNREFFQESADWVRCDNKDDCLQLFEIKIEKLMHTKFQRKNTSVLEEVIYALKCHQLNHYQVGEELSNLLVYVRALLKNRNVHSSVIIPIKLPEEEFLPYVVFFLYLLDSLFNLSELSWQAFWTIPDHYHTPMLFFSFSSIDYGDWSQIIRPPGYSVTSKIDIQYNHSLYEAVPQLIGQIRKGFF